jgi:uncharacterized membrane protein YccC
VGERLAEGRIYDAEVVKAKRRAESAGAGAFSSLQRMSGDPKGVRDLMNELAVVANGNQRVTRALNLIVLQTHPDRPLPEAKGLAAHKAAALEELARALQDPAARKDALGFAQEQLRAATGGGLQADGNRPSDIALRQFERTGTEIGAMLISAAELTGPEAK